jgi:hypothetical protein
MKPDELEALMERLTKVVDGVAEHSAAAALSNVLALLIAQSATTHDQAKVRLDGIVQSMAMVIDRVLPPSSLRQ